jgi:hypothetical protein
VRARPQFYRLLPFLTLASIGFSALPALKGGPETPAPEFPSEFTDYLIKSVATRYKAAEFATGRSALEVSYFRGKVDGINAQAIVVGRNPNWMSNFRTKTDVERVRMEMEEQHVFLFILFGADPKTEAYQYWQGYEDAIQETIDSMNTWPKTGGTVPGTAVEFALASPAGVLNHPNQAAGMPKSGPKVPRVGQ